MSAVVCFEGRSRAGGYGVVGVIEAKKEIRLGFEYT
jgi:hypothetical protein